MSYGQPIWLVEPLVRSPQHAEYILMLFVRWLCRSVQASTAQCYLSGVRDLHVRYLGVVPLSPQAVRLPLLIKAMRRRDAAARTGSVPPEKRKVTLKMLRQIATWLTFASTNEYFDTLIFDMMLVAFFGLLRVSEFTIRNRTLGFSAERDLTWSKVEFFPRGSPCPSFMYINLGICKGDQFQDQYIYVRCTDEAAICPVRHLHRRRNAAVAAGCGEPDHPVFLLSQHKPVHRRTFARGMIFLLAAACGRPFDHFGTHSLRRGGAQALRDAGAPPWVVQLLGRWSSDAYKRYCDTDLNVVLDWTQRMGVEHDALHHDDLVATS